MSFCKFSSEVIVSNSTNVENVFIHDFMPNASGDSIKVYLFGLYKCQTAQTNSLEEFCTALSLAEQDILSIFTYWQELGLVQILNTIPYEIRYLPIKHGASTLKKFNKDKYKAFNMQAQEIISGRMLTPNEFQEYYYVIENLHMEEDALLMIMQYCVSLKKNNIGYSYILTVAKDWAYDCILTCEQVENRLKQLDASNDNLKLIFKMLGTSVKPNLDDYQLYLTWTNEFNFEIDVLLHLAKLTKAKKGNIQKLSQTVSKCYELNLRSIKEIDNYYDSITEHLNIAKSVCRNLGIRYDNLSVVVEEYIVKWISFGYDQDTLQIISLYCFKCGIKTLDGMNQNLVQFYKLGVVTRESLDSYMQNIMETDKKIKEVLDALGIVRYVNKFDRSYYNTWVNEWNTNNEVLDYAISISHDKFQPMQFLNKLLSIYHVKNITTVENAKREKVDFGNNYAKPADKSPTKQEYTKAELDSLFSSITEVEL